MSLPAGADGRLAPEQARKLFERNVFLIIHDLPRGSQVSLDGLEDHLTDSSFQGFKLLPAGWHLLTWTGAPSTASSASNSAVPDLDLQSVRCGLFRKFEQGQVVVRRYDSHSERLVHPEALPPLRSARKPGKSTDLPSNTVTSLEHLRSLDPRLAPFDFSKLERWTRTTKHLQSANPVHSHRLLAALIGCDGDSGDFWTDALAPMEQLEADGTVCATPGGHGKRAQEQEAEAELDRILSEGRKTSTFGKRQTEAQETTAPQPAFADAPTPAVQLPKLDLKRSWPPGATGAELTRWSMDKSWLLSTFLASCRTIYGWPEGSGEHEPGLILLEVVFLLFAVVRNGACMQYWADLVTLFCNSPAMVGAPGDFEEHPAFKVGTESTLKQATASTVAPQPGLIADFLQCLHAQMSMLPEDFFEAPDGHTEMLLDQTVANLKKCRSHIARALAADAVMATATQGSSGGSGPKANDPARLSVRSGTAGRGRRAPVGTSDDSEEPQGAETETKPNSALDKLLEAWRPLSQLMRTKYKVELDDELDEETEARHGDDGIVLEEGEDAPIIVEL